MEITDVTSAPMHSKHRGSQQVRVQDGGRAHFVHLRWTVEGDMPHAKHVFDYVLVGILDALKVGSSKTVATECPDCNGAGVTVEPGADGGEVGFLCHCDGEGVPTETAWRDALLYVRRLIANCRRAIEIEETRDPVSLGPVAVLTPDQLDSLEKVVDIGLGAVPVRSAEASASEKVLPLGVPADIHQRIVRVINYAGQASDSSWLHGSAQGREATRQFGEDCPVVEKWLKAVESGVEPLKPVTAFDKLRKTLVDLIDSTYWDRAKLERVAFCERVEAMKETADQMEEAS